MGDNARKQMFGDLKRAIVQLTKMEESTEVMIEQVQLIGHQHWNIIRYTGGSRAMDYL